MRWFLAKEILTIKKPNNISFQEASCLSMIGSAALTALEQKGRITKNQEILINWCTWWVGHIATQIAKKYWTKITGICSNKNIQIAKKFGVDIVIDYKKEYVYCLNKKFDIIFDTVGNLKYKKAKTILKNKGKFLDLNPTGLWDIIYSLFSSWYKVIMASANKEHLVKLSKLVKNNELKPIIGKVVNLNEAIDTIASMEKWQKTLGKTVIITE